MNLSRCPRIVELLTDSLPARARTRRCRWPHLDRPWRGGAKV